ncbi:cobalt/nickel transport system permease protein [Antricoccus suffuscus]|uniref:Cobalt/nickel transport system permease protein n=1 Tax=Antricoccus suffuscus TaxID=1629062 RepID=A0A2T0ZXY1_9ACTN|nr:cobalt transporter CbiM [Antricoccus suffuscus]PRZ41144.1 cobalt/nickel transport system permease protein [Antricoccus suffuscus]
MHIPDGYLSPATCAVGFAITVPMAAIASAKIKKTVKTRQVPTLAMLSAVCFLIMMFNVPIPDGTTAHAVGGALVAVLLGPWAALIAVAVALAFQALLFGDGGVLAYGVNVLNMAIILPFVSYGIYRLISKGSALTSTRRVTAAAIGGYVGINAAALACGIELGIQPLLFHTANGTPLYSPYHLSQSVPAMMLAHLSVAGVVEAIITGGVIAYLQRANLPLLRTNNPDSPEDRTERTPRKLRPIYVALAAVVLMAALTPLGLLAPGGAFGEDAPSKLNLGGLGLKAIPSGLAKYTGFWKHTLLDGYGFSSGAHPVIGYILSAVVGVLAIGVAVFVVAIIIRAISRRRTADPSSDSTCQDKAVLSEHVR